MMKAKFSILMTLLLMLACAACENSSSGDDDSDDDTGTAGDDDDNEGGTYEGCEENNVPEFLSITIIVNGVAVEEPVTLDTDDALAFSIEYYDKECNFQMDDRRGSVEFRPSDADAYAYGDAAKVLGGYYYLDGIGCSSEEDGPFIVNANPNDFAVPDDFNRLEPLLVYLTDACLNNSNVLNVDFTVYPAK